MVERVLELVALEHVVGRARLVARPVLRVDGAADAPDAAFLALDPDHDALGRAAVVDAVDHALGEPASPAASWARAKDTIAPVGGIGRFFRGSSRSSARARRQEERVAAYVIREHDRGRSLDDILDDPYVKNRASQPEVARLLDRPDVIKAIGDDIAEAAKADLPASSTTRSRDRKIPGRETVRLEDDDVLVGLAARQLARDDLLELVHLQPVEHALADRLDQVARLDLRVRERVAADEGRALEHRVVELARLRPVRAGRADERAGLQPLAAQDRVARRRDRDDDVLRRRVAVTLSGLGADLAAERVELLLVAAVGDDLLDARAAPRGCTRPASRAC